MPSSTEHRDKAHVHRQFLTTIDTAAHPEWAAVVAFYTALHLVERLAACESLHHDKHPTRLHYLLKHKQHRAIHRPMSKLFDASHAARYATVGLFRRSFPTTAVRAELIGQHLHAVEVYVANFFDYPPP